MSWQLTEPVSGLTVELRPSEGDIEIEEGQDTAVHYGLRNPSPQVTDSARRAATVRVPDCVFRSVADVDQLRILRDLSRRCVLTDDLGREFPVRFVGPLVQRVVDVPGRAEGAALIYVKLNFVGVA